MPRNRPYVNRVGKSRRKKVSGPSDPEMEAIFRDPGLAYPKINYKGDVGTPVTPRVITPTKRKKRK